MIITSTAAPAATWGDLLPVMVPMVVLLLLAGLASRRRSR